MGIFNKAKNLAKGAAHVVGDAAEATADFAGDVGKGAAKAGGKAWDKAGDAADAAGDKLGDAGDAVAGGAKKAWNKAADVVDGDD